jgi:adenine-specific DNA-methyltransferase
MEPVLRSSRRRPRAAKGDDRASCTLHSSASTTFQLDTARSWGNPDNASTIFHADNRAALRSLVGSFANRFRCIYLDPPFNTGRLFGEYDDRLAASDWHAMLREQIELLHPLLAEDGAIFAEIDDTELCALQTILDSVFGRENRISTITLVRSASTGHKAINRGPVNVTDFLLLYAKDRRRFRPRQMVRPRRDYDRAYRTFVEGDLNAPATWSFLPVSQAAARDLGFESAQDARASLGGDGWQRAWIAFAMKTPERVVRTAQVRFDAVAQRTRDAIGASRAEPDRVFVLERTDHPSILLKNGDRILFLKDKVRPGPRGNELVEPLTNVWDDIPFQGIAGEGGVTFVRNKKPERLLERILSMATDRGDWVLDPFLGSGTTGAVALKMGRPFVGIERGDHLDTMCLPRLRAVVDGTSKGGIDDPRVDLSSRGFRVHG